MNYALSFVFILSFLLGGFSNAKTTLVETHEYSEIFEFIEKKLKVVDKSELLVVFDVDDTLLVIDHCIHKGKLTKGIGKLFNCPSVLTEPQVSQEIEKLQELGVPTFALTARSKSMAKATLRELDRQSIDFELSPFEESKKFKVMVEKCTRGKNPTCTSKNKSFHFTEGVMFAGGHKKGWMLETLLKELGQSYSHIIFVDDRKKNMTALTDEYGTRDDVDMTLFLYLRHRD